MRSISAPATLLLAVSAVALPAPSRMDDMRNLVALAEESGATSETAPNNLEAREEAQNLRNFVDTSESSNSVEARATSDPIITPETLAQPPAPRSERSEDLRNLLDAHDSAVLATASRSLEARTASADTITPGTNVLEARRTWGTMSEAVAFLIVGLNARRHQNNWPTDYFESRADLVAFMATIWAQFGTSFSSDEQDEAQAAYFRHRNWSNVFPAQDEFAQAYGIVQAGNAS